MNTNNLKRFAQETRLRLLKEVADKLDYVLNQDRVELREYEFSIPDLEKDIKRMGRAALIDKVAYTWFNRLMALRFMDANDYQPLHLMVVSPKEGFTQAEILDEAMQGHISDELRVDRERINQLLDGKIISNNPQNEIYRMLLIASCNYLNTLFPFLFEKLNHYTELLLPDDLTSELSIIKDFVNGMTKEDCQHVEVMGWLYQFYISDRKDEVFAEKGRVEKEDIPAATQLFTPRWIVEYMVQNTVGKLWMQNNPHSSLRDKMPYYIETDSSKSDDYLKINSPEELTLLDQACGSGHILVYGFELLYHIYEEAGYQPSQIPELIIEKNLFGYEIDERAAQLASFTVLMKARSYYRRLFRNPVQPNIFCYKDLTISEDDIENAFELLNKKLTDELKTDLILMQQATNLGSLIQPQTAQSELEALEKLLAEKQNSSDVFLQKLFTELYMAVVQLRKLSKKFCCVVDNPPYMGGGNMNKELADFVKIKYPDSKADLMACFMEGGLAALHTDGILGMINQHSWMFLSSYEKLREKLIKHTQFDTLLHLGPRTFPEIGGEVVQNAAFTFINREPDKKSSYIRLIDYKDSITKSEKTLEAIQNPDCGWFYTKNQKDFEKIPGWNIGYWLSEKIIDSFIGERIVDFVNPKSGLSTTDNQQFLRFIHEINVRQVGINNSNTIKAQKSGAKWFPYNKGGTFRRWFGNLEYFVNWYNDGEDIRKCIASDPKKQVGGRIVSYEFYFRESINWSSLSSGSFSCRYSPQGYLFDSKGPAIFFDEYEAGIFILGLLNTKVAQKYLNILSPTLDYNQGPVGKIPLKNIKNPRLIKLIEYSIECSREEWNSRETSWDFKQNELIRFNGQDIEEAIELYKQYWTNQFYELHHNEEELNKEFIHIYGLAEELDPDVALEDITLLRDELDQRALKELSAEYRSGWQLVDGRWSLVDSNSGNNNNNNKYDKGLQRPEGMATRNKSGENDLLCDAVNAERGALQPDRSDKESRRECAQQYSGGTSERGKGVQTLSEDSSGVSFGTGDATYTHNRASDAKSDRDFSNIGLYHQPEETNKQSYKQSDKNYTLTTIHHLPSTIHHLPSTIHHPPSTIHHPPSTIHHPPSTIHHLPSTIHHLPELPFDEKELVMQFISYAVGCMFGRYSIDKEGLILANQGEGIDDFFEKVGSKETLRFIPDEDGIIPVLDEEWFEDDIVSQFKIFVKAVWGEQDLQRNIDYMERVLGKPLRNYFYRDFYNDHIRRYKKRPIYWMVSSDQGEFQALIYLHRYTKDSISLVLNDYYRPYINKLRNHIEHLEHVAVDGSAGEQTKAKKEIVKLEKVVAELLAFDKKELYPLATSRVELDLDDGVLVNYNKLGAALQRVAGLNDAAAKKKVRGFDWIDVKEIR